jgi:hypothetical protein
LVAPRTKGTGLLLLRHFPNANTDSKPLAVMLKLDTGLFQHLQYLGQSLVGRHAIPFSNRFNVASAIPAAFKQSDAAHAL